jgi:ketosteroid isomerase-like protein
LGRSRLILGRLVIVILAAACSLSCRSESNVQAEPERIRATERERLRALVNADLEVASRLHADDFQLINPAGASVSKEQYLKGIASGEIDYLRWDPGAIEVRQYGEAAVIRYQSELDIIVGGRKVGLRRYWHTDLYERRGGQWQVVWSHATAVE